MDSIKPIKRTKLRLLAGRIYYTLNRNCYWAFGGMRFAKSRSAKLKHECFSHETPLIRNLQDTDIALQYNKINNLQLAVQRLNKIVINPGETFSYWRLIGKPTYKKGYQDGMVLFCGTVQRGVGGGLCQLSNLIYWMTLHTPLTVVERHRHSYDVFPDSDRTQPFGSGATCVYNYRDLMIRNDTKHVFQLILNISDKYLSGSWYSDMPMHTKYEIYEINHKMERQYWGGYIRHNELRRKIYTLDGDIIADEFITENNAIMMYQPFIDYKSTQADRL